MRKPHCLFLLAAVIAFCASSAAAASLPLEMLPASTRWVLHLDMQALRESMPGKDPFAVLAGTPQETVLRTFEKEFSCDVRRDLSSATVCGSGGRAQGCVVYLRGRWDFQKLSRACAGNPAFATASYGRHALLSWSKARVADGADRANVCLVSSSLVLLATRETTLRWALDALDGKTPTLAMEPRFRQMAAMDAHSAVRMVAVDLKEIVAEIPMVATFPVGDTLRAALSADGQNLHLNAVLTARTSEEAQQMHQALVGMQAVMMFQGFKKPEVAAMAQSAHVSVDGDNVYLALSARVDTLKCLVFRPK